MTALTASWKPATAPADESRLGRFLGHHFGDGLVYLTGGADRELLREAREQGLVDEQGYLTNRGYRFWRHHGD